MSVYVLSAPNEANPEKPTVYIGASGNLRARVNWHVSNAAHYDTKPVERWLRPIGKPTVTILEQTTRGRVADLERRTIAAYRNAGFVVLNTTDAGMGLSHPRRTRGRSRLSGAPRRQPVLRSVTRDAGPTLTTARDC